MKRLLNRVGQAWSWLMDARYRRRQKRLAADEQRFEDRQARHEAGIFEPPHGGV